MDVSCRATRILFETAEAAGIPRERLAEGLDVDLDALANTRNTVPWTTLTKLLDRLSELVDHDPDRIRDIGSYMMVVPSYDLLPKLARNFVSVRTLCEAANRWVAPALFPHLPLKMDLRVTLPAHPPS